jgi:hypothetical protein
MNQRFTPLLLLAAWLLGGPNPAPAEETLGTLQLDGLSFISFEDLENLAIPSGSSIRFHFGSPAADGSVPFSIAPSDVSIAPIALDGDGSTLTYGLAAAASGWIRKNADGTPRVEFTALVAATLAHPEIGGTKQHALHFTTQAASATNLAGTQTVSVEGVPLVEGANYVQLVGAVANKADAYPEPGKAVYTVLSGRFDQLPDLP